MPLMPARSGWRLQQPGQVFRLAHRNYVLSQGRVWGEGTGAKLMADESLRACYLGMV